MLQISAQFPARLRQHGAQNSRVVVQMQLELADPFAVGLIILQDGEGFGWAISAEDLSSAISQPGQEFGLGCVKIRREKRNKVVRIVLPTAGEQRITLRCPASEVEQFVRCANQVVESNGLLEQYLDGGYAEIKELLANQ